MAKQLSIKHRVLYMCYISHLLNLSINNFYGEFKDKGLNLLDNINNWI